MFLLGLDGATFTLLRPWAEEGHLPTIARLMKEGAHGPLISTIPPVTPVAWTSMVTGVYPGKHGIFGFAKSRPESYERDLVTSHDRRRPAIWNLLDLAGLRSIVVDVPFTYPPEPINGVMVSGLGTPDVAAEFVYPGMLREALLRELGPYPLGIHYHKSVTGMIEEAHRLTEHRLALTRFLMRDFDWDFFMLVLMTTDQLQHVMWKYLDPHHPRYDPGDAARYGPRILDYYRRLDGVIGELLALLPPSASLMVVSDHGAGPLTSGVSLGRWACQAGLLTLGGCRWAFAPPDQVPQFVPTGAGRVDARPDGLALDVAQPDAHAGTVFRVPGLDPLRSYEVRAVVRDATPGAYLCII